MEKLKLSAAYISRYGLRINLATLTPEEKECAEKAIELHNQNLPCRKFVDWMCGQPEVMKFFSYGVWLTKSGRKASLYQLCEDISLRLAAVQRIVG